MISYDKSTAPPLVLHDDTRPSNMGPPNYGPPQYGYPGQPAPTSPPYPEANQDPFNNPPYGYPNPNQSGYNNQQYSGQPAAAGFVEQGYGQPLTEDHTITSNYISNAEDGETVNFASFNEKSVRLGFIKKVFGILAVQMLITGGIMCAFIFSDTIKNYARTHSWLYIASMCVYFAAVIALACFDSARRKVPLNFILLLFLTLAMSVMLGSIASTFDAKEILMAVGIVFAIVVVCAILGIQQKFDFTYLLGIMVVLTFGLIFFGIFCAIFRSNIANIAYASIGAILFSLWLVIDIQMIMGGKHKYQCDPEEYIFAALNLYLDIVNILMYVLMLIGSSK